MKCIFTCIVVSLAALFLGSGCSTTSSTAASPSGGQDANATATHDIYTPAVAAPQ